VFQLTRYSWMCGSSRGLDTRTVASTALADSPNSANFRYPALVSVSSGGSETIITPDPQKLHADSAVTPADKERAVTRSKDSTSSGILGFLNSSRNYGALSAARPIEYFFKEFCSLHHRIVNTARQCTIKQERPGSPPHFLSRGKRRAGGFSLFQQSANLRNA